eukprot:3077810-Amphidinium_carterae.1
MHDTIFNPIADLSIPRRSTQEVARDVAGAPQKSDSDTVHPAGRANCGSPPPNTTCIGASFGAKPTIIARFGVR